MKTQKLYDLPRMCRVKIEGFTLDGKLNEEFNFHHIDGMYSFCTNDKGLVFHLRCDTEVEFIKRLEL